MRYTHHWKTDISSGSQLLKTCDLLDAIHIAIRYGQQFPEVTQQKIVDGDDREVCVLRDTCFNGK